MMPEAGNHAREMHGLLEEIAEENQRRKKYPRLKQIKINVLRHRVADYLTRRLQADEKISQQEKELGRPLRLKEAAQFEGRLHKERKALINDLRFCSAGFEGGSGQMYSIIGEIDVFMDEATGWLPPEYHDLAKKMSRLSKGERYQIINNLHDEGTIDGHQHDELVRLFIDDISDENTCDIGLKGDPVMSELINPSFCPFFHEHSDGSKSCEYRPKEDENAEEVDEKDDSMANECNDSSVDYSDSDDVSVEDDSDSYDYSFNGESLDVDDASGIDVDFDGNSAGYDFDFDGGDYDGGDYGGGSD